MVGLYRDQPEVIDARRAVTEGAPVTREMPVRRFDRLEANQRLRLTHVPVSDTQLVIYTIDVAPPSMAEAAPARARGTLPRARHGHARRRRNLATRLAPC